MIAAVYHKNGDAVQNAQCATHLPDGNRRNRRPGASLNLQGLHHQRKLVGPRGSERIQLERLNDVDTVYDEQNLVNGKRELRIRVGIDLDAMLSDPTSMGSCRARYSAASMPIPGHPFA
jgi:hypothetical protein